MVEWFRNLERKSNSKFLKFDVVDFYPSITESLLINALNFAKAKSDLCDNEINIIRHARNSLLFKNNEVWNKNRIMLTIFLMSVWEVLTALKPVS